MKRISLLAVGLLVVAAISSTSAWAVFGACCKPDGTCIDDLRQDRCIDVFGGILFPDTACDEVDCNGGEQPLECRVTGGGNDTDPWDGSLAEGESPHGNRINRYTFGGQAGAPTASQPQPFGEWTHHQQRGPMGRFVFHAGTASAPGGTEIDLIVCSDPGFCNPARPAPAHQIDFEGVGSFNNVGNSSPIAGLVVEGVSLHWFSVHVEDAGEPGGTQSGEGDETTCPVGGSAGGTVDCSCGDYYSITIHAGPDSSSSVIYHVEGYIRGGNLQIHPPVGGSI
jgi:hypothetical protein